MIRPVVAHADQLLAQRGHRPLPQGVTAHKLRHTFTSILFVRGEDPAYVMSQLGHADAGFTLRVYAHAMRRDEAETQRLRALVEGRHWAPLGTSEGENRPDEGTAEGSGNAETPATAGVSREAAEGTRTLDLLHGKQTL